MRHSPGSKTVSRAIANKYIRTPHGVFEFKYFFTPGYQAESGAAVSNTSVKEMIADLIDLEDKAGVKVDDLHPHKIDHLTCSCSGKVSREAFEQMLIDAAHDGELDVLFSSGGNFLEVLPELAAGELNVRFERLPKFSTQQPNWTFYSPHAERPVLQYLARRWPLEYRLGLEPAYESRPG